MIGYSSKKYYIIAELYQFFALENQNLCIPLNKPIDAIMHQTSNTYKVNETLFIISKFPKNKQCYQRSAFK